LETTARVSLRQTLYALRRPRGAPAVAIHAEGPGTAERWRRSRCILLGVGRVAPASADRRCNLLWRKLAPIAQRSRRNWRRVSRRMGRPSRPETISRRPSGSQSIRKGTSNGVRTTTSGRHQDRPSRSLGTPSPKTKDGSRANAATHPSRARSTVSRGSGDGIRPARAHIPARRG
jgi:hypothetical protein